GPYAEMGWTIAPAGLTELLLRLHREYPDLPLMITENGAALADEVVPDPSRATGRAVHDDKRVADIRDHVGAVLDAVEAGADLRGDPVCSFPPHFAWGHG